jgi:hypothetical protein
VSERCRIRVTQISRRYADEDMGWLVLSATNRISGFAFTRRAGDAYVCSRQGADAIIKGCAARYKDLKLVIETVTPAAASTGHDRPAEYPIDRDPTPLSGGSA